MSEKKKQNSPEVVTKPFLTGSITDENTIKNAFKFFGIMLLIIFMSFIVCSLTSFENNLLRIALNVMIVSLVLIILYNKGTKPGTDAVARGEILYQRQENGQDVTSGERRLSYHPMKGYLNAFLGTLPFLIPAVIYAFSAEKTTTSFGTLPDWVGSMINRSEIGDALVSYTNPAGLTSTDFLRMFVRIFIMPFVSMAGSTNREGLLLVERLSPLILLLPGIAYGSGYLNGKRIRTRIHTEIEENKKKKKRRDLREQRARREASAPKEPEQLN